MTKQKLVTTVMLAVAFTAILGLANPASAIPPAKYTLTQNYPTVGGTTVTGDCTLQIEGGTGDLKWHIKVKGLDPFASGHFDLNHFVGETDVPFTADVGGNANSGMQFVSPGPPSGSPVECHVHMTSPSSHFDSPGIASSGSITTP